MRREQSILKQLDWVTIITWLIMIICGWATIYAACYDYDFPSPFDIHHRQGQQLMWMGISSLVAIFILAIDTKFFGNISYFFYILMLGLLVVTIFIAPDVKGSHSWIQLGSFRFQPAELAKYATALCLAKFMTTYGYNMKRPRDFIITGLIIAMPMLIIVAQQETGSALVFAIFILVLFREGLNGDFLVYIALCAIFFVLVIKYGFMLVFLLATIIGLMLVVRYTKDSLLFKTYAITAVSIWTVGLIVKMVRSSLISYTTISIIAFSACALLFLIFAFIRRSKTHLAVILFFIGTAALCFVSDYAFNKVLQPHQQIRIKVVLGLEDDPQGAGYNVRQAQIAIGSGGFFGKGFLNGTQTKLNYVPEQDTDFIFCTIGEEKGFMGTFTVILLYVFFICRLLYLAERQRTPFSRIYGYSVACIFFFHFSINIGMVIGLLPVIGIPLPFFSYGGSSMLAFTILLFTFIKLDTRHMDTMAA